MDVLKPSLQFIDGFCYRINPGSETGTYETANQPYYEPDAECLGLNEPEDEENYEIVAEANGRFKTSFHVPKIFFPYIIGVKGATKKRVENETRTTIIVPKQGQAGDIVITGSEKKNVASARNRVNLLVTSARKKQRSTHFLSTPLNGTTIRNSFLEFKKGVLEKCPGIDEKLFQEPERLHLTYGLLSLYDDVERREAAIALEECKKEVIVPLMKKPIKVRMKGLDYMNDDPSRVKVLYGKVTPLEDENIFQYVADSIAEFFFSKGLMENNKVLIHVTLMNSKFASQDEGSQMNDTFFDASSLLQLYHDYDFGVETISKIDISVLHTRNDGYWQSSASISIP